MFNRIQLRLRVLTMSVAFVVCLVASSAAYAQGTAFTYQGRLTDAGNPADGLYDMQFKLFDIAGSELGSTPNLSVQVTNGVFTVLLDFAPCAACFNGSARFIEIGIRPTGSPDPHTILSPRQPVTATPYAIRSSVAASADGLSVACVNCVTSSQIQNVAGSQVSGAIPVASVPAGSGNYIQNNPASQQVGSNFNISGNGTAGGTLSANTVNVVNAATGYYIGGNRVLSVAGLNNLFAGVAAGVSNTGISNSFFGDFAGPINTGSSNAFFGRNAGTSNNTGSENSFFGTDAGRSNTFAFANSFFGTFAGSANTLGGNSFFGRFAGHLNETGSSNTMIGVNADVGANDLTNATAIGARAFVDQSHSLVLGGITGINGGTSVNVGIGLTAPKTRLDVVSTQSQMRFGNNSADSGGYLVSTAPSQAVIAGGAKWDGDDFVAKSTSSSVINMFNGIIRFSNNTGLTPETTFNETERMRITEIGRVGIGTTTPDQLLTVNGGASKPAGGSWATFSDLRLKTLKGSFTAGLNAVMQLQPIRYEYKRDNALGINTGGEHIGFAAQAVEKVIPEAVTKNAQGYLLVNNDPILWSMLNSIKELKAENDELMQQLKQQEERLRRIEAAMEAMREAKKN